MNNSSDDNNSDNKDNNDKKKPVLKKKIIIPEINRPEGEEIIIEISDKVAQAKLTKANLKLKNLNLKGLETSINIKGLNDQLKILDESFLDLKNLLNNKELHYEIKAHIRDCFKDLEASTQSTSDSATKVIDACQKAGKDARHQKRYDIAIGILSELDKSILPAISKSLSKTKINGIKESVLKELEKAYLEKGKIEEAIKIIEKRAQVPQIEPSQFIKSQLDKSNLLMKKGEFNKALNVLNKTLKFQKAKNLDIRYSAEIKRVLGIAYRGKGAYDKALEWFDAAEVEFKKISDEEHYNRVKWGKGILFYLRGDFEEAIKIWKELMSYYEYVCYKEGPACKEYFSIYLSLQFEYIRTLELSGKFDEAEKVLYRTLGMIEDHPELKEYQMDFYLILSEFYYLTEKIEDAVASIKKVKILNDQRKATNDLYTLNELKLLKHELEILLATGNSQEARERLLHQFDDCKSNWDLYLYYTLLAKIEKYDMNFGLAKRAYLSALEIIREIGVFSLSDELFYAELLIGMAKSGNQVARQEAESYLLSLEKKITQERLPAIKLEFQLLKAQLACIHANYDDAYQILSETFKEADEKRYLRQKTKTAEALSLLEQQGKGFGVLTRETSVLRYLEDARRTLEDYS